MGVVVDTSVFISHERRGSSVQAMRANLLSASPTEEFVLSSLSVAELVEGLYRAVTPEQTSRRRNFVQAAIHTFPIVPFSTDTAWVAGKIRGEQGSLGNTLPLGDSLIAAVALELGYSVLTLNVHDFARIPGLVVIPFTYQP